VPAGEGWFVLNARDARWNYRPERRSVTFTGSTDFEAETYFPQLGVNLAVLQPGQTNSMYHWETETEAFLMLSGEALLVIEGQERPLRQWDFVHCPPQTNHVIVGAGDGPCVILSMSSREFQADGPWGWYTANEVARRHGASPEEDTQEADIAYASVPESAGYPVSRSSGAVFAVCVLGAGQPSQQLGELLELLDAEAPVEEGLDFGKV
jgi:uncharacterized cupin superfamily protein